MDHEHHHDTPRHASRGKWVFIGFLLQWPTLVTLFMFPVLVTMYAMLARREEREVLAQFGDAYRQYAQRVPAFFPRLSGADTAPPQLRS